jgi:endonuclease/exonuclease/phosphatase (EEP) superfamily protein YafD
MLTPYLYLPAYGIGLIAWKRRHYRLAVLAVFVILGQIWQISPQLWNPDALQAAETSGVALRLFSMNLTVDNPEAAALVDEIHDQQPDMLFFQEYTTVWHAELDRQGLFETYRYGRVNIQGQQYGTAIWSKRPIMTEVREVEDVTLLFASMDVDGRPVQFLTLHLPGVWDDFARSNTRMAVITDMLLHTSGPFVSIGDYNQPAYNRWYQMMTNGRLRDAHQTCNAAWDATWPNDILFPTSILLDHALLSPEIGCMHIQEGQGKGSEHKSVIVDIMLLPEAMGSQ